MSVLEITNYEDHENFIRKYPMGVIFFGSSNCGHCKAAIPLINDLAREYPEIMFAHVEITKVKTENIDAVPAFVGYKQGIPVDVVLGASPDEIVNMLETKVL